MQFGWDKDAYKILAEKPSGRWKTEV